MPIPRVRNGNAGIVMLASLLLTPTLPYGSAAQSEPSLSQSIVLQGLSHGLGVDAISACGLSPGDVPLLFEALSQNSVSLNAVTGTAEELRHAIQVRGKIEQAIRRVGESPELLSQLDAAVQAVELAESAAANSRTAFSEAMNESLESQFGPETRARLVNAIHNANRKVPAAIRIAPPDSVDWVLVESAYSIFSDSGISDLSPEEANAWNAAWSRVDVIEAEQSRTVNGVAVATAFGAYFSTIGG